MTTYPTKEDSQSRYSDGNQRRKDVRVGRSNVGKGVFSGRWFRPDQIVGEILGQVIYDEHYGSDYCMYIGDGRCLEPEAPFRYINHSCEPNCEFDWYDLHTEGESSVKRRVFLFALQVIRPGDELTITGPQLARSDADARLLLAAAGSSLSEN